ncbi:MAG TPA: hypothetical protein VKS24_18245 [Bradyrhizobium sp.]|nr:hypothetical protein [Bradyrhizobium sp.]
MPSDSNGRGRVLAAFLFLFIFLVAGGYFVTGLDKLQDRNTLRESQAALQSITDPAQIDEALRQNPSNKILRLMSMAIKATNETRAATEKLSGEIEPPSVSKAVDFGKASRGDLEALRHDLKAAEANATSFLPRYVALYKAERDKVENDARSLRLDKDTMGNLLAGIDKRHAKTIALTSRVLSALADYYRAYEKYVAFLVGELGSYKVVDGQFIFPLQRTVERYGVAANAMTAAAKRVAELEEERKKLKPPLQEEWAQFVRAK